MKKFIILASLIVLTVVWMSFVWGIDDGVKIEYTGGNHLHKDAIVPSAVTYKLFGTIHTIPYNKSYLDVPEYEQFELEGCEYFTTNLLNEKAWTHKGNCKNSIHPENSFDWIKLNKLLNSPLINNILQQ